MQIFTYNLCYLEPQRQQTSSSFYDLYVAVFFVSTSPLCHHYHASPHFALHKDCLISVEDRRWWGKLAGKSVNSQRKDKESTGCSNGEWSQPQELDNFLILFTRLSPLRGCSKQRELKLKKHPERNNYTWTSEKTNVWSLGVRHIEQVLACWIGECQSSPQSMGKMLSRLGIYIPTHPVTS